MPTQTFFNLSDKKQCTIIHAAVKEFSRVPLYEASIANIVKEACIPRGSFYQYFEGKEDLYYYLLHHISERNSTQFLTYLRVHNGDLFAAFIDLFQFMIQYHHNPEQKNLFRHIFLNLNYQTENVLARNLYEEHRQHHFNEVIALIDAKLLNVCNQQELHALLKIVMSVTFQSLMHVFVKKLPDEVALKHYQAQIELLKRGLAK